MKTRLSCLIFFLSSNCLAGTPIFSVTPIVGGQSQLVQSQQGTYIYQVTNNTNFTLANIGFNNLPSGVTSVINAGLQYCSFPLTLTSGTSCLIKMNINSNVTPSSIQGGPQVCFTAAKPVYCSQPLNVNQFSTQILPGPLLQDCSANISNFNFTLTQTFDTTPVDEWGPTPNKFSFSSSNPDLRNCSTTAGISWSQQRLLAAADLWIRQKMNYCHHHVPDYMTPASTGGVPRARIPTNAGGYCNPINDIMPGSVYFGQQSRWNYSGTGSETISQWQNNNGMWYGLDCSDYTAFLYNFSLSTDFDSDVAFQAGQRNDRSQDLLSPNEQSGLNVLDNPKRAGTLLCKNGDLEVNHSCGSGDNLYFSKIDKTGQKTLPITDDMIKLLKPGDLLYLAFPLDIAPNTSEVTHVFMWTGKQVGNAPGNIPASQIAPESICPESLQPKAGDWVITDSTYQGPDYRIFTDCFYKNNIWGVRRVIT